MASQTPETITALYLRYLLAIRAVHEQVGCPQPKRARTIQSGERSQQELRLACDANCDMIARMSHFEFKRMYRFSWNAFEWICGRLSVHESIVAVEARAGRTPITAVDVRLLMTLEYLATGAKHEKSAYVICILRSALCSTGCPIPNLARTYRHPPTTAWRWIRSTIATITKVFAAVITFPKKEELPMIAQGFEKRAGLRYCVGALDGCVIKSTLWGQRTPSGLDEYYCARKDTYGILLHAMVDSTMRFRFWQTGLGASHGDSRALRLSSLWRRQLEAEPLVPAPYYIIGDSAYPMKSWLIRPLTDSEAHSQKHMAYNHAISRTRIIVEQTFGKMKHQWGIVYSALSNKGPDLVRDALCAILILHNLTIDLDRDNIFNEEQLRDFERLADTDDAPQEGDGSENWWRARHVMEEAWALHVKAHPSAAGHEEEPFIENVLQRITSTGTRRQQALSQHEPTPEEGDT